MNIYAPIGPFSRPEMEQLLDFSQMTSSEMFAFAKILSIVSLFHLLIFQTIHDQIAIDPKQRSTYLFIYPGLLKVNDESEMI